MSLYSGPDYRLEFKYAWVMKMVFVSFMFCTAFPLVIPTALFALINIAIFDKYLIAYWHRSPPNYDSKLNDRAMLLMYIPPILCFSIAIYTMSDKKIFSHLHDARLKNIS